MNHLYKNNEIYDTWYKLTEDLSTCVERMLDEIMDEHDWDFMKQNRYISQTHSIQHTVDEQIWHTVNLSSLGMNYEGKWATR